MAVDEIDNLRNTQSGNIRGFSITLERATQLGINVRIDEQFRSVSRGARVALIHDGNAFRWITFDNMAELTWNLSNPVIEREQAIDETSANLLVEHGESFVVPNPRHN